MDSQSALHGLNIVQPPPARAEGFLTDAQDLLGSPGDLAGQLDMWTNLIFASDEPLPSRQSDEGESHKRKRDSQEDIPPSKRFDLPTANNSSQSTHMNLGSDASEQAAQRGFDLGDFLRGFAVDPFLVAPNSLSPPSTLLTQPTALQSPLTSPTSTASTNHNRNSAAAPKSSAKKPRARKVPAEESSPFTPTPASLRPETPHPDDDDISTPPTVAEDKRRRNTAASARFRLKKKEREVALEKRSKELEAKVGDLERECEALRKENGWLKGLVVSVTTDLPAPEDLALDKEMPAIWSRAAGEEKKDG